MLPLALDLTMNCLSVGIGGTLRRIASALPRHPLSFLLASHEHRIFMLARIRVVTGTSAFRSAPSLHCFSAWKISICVIRHPIRAAPKQPPESRLIQLVADASPAENRNPLPAQVSCWCSCQSPDQIGCWHIFLPNSILSVSRLLTQPQRNYNTRVL